MAITHRAVGSQITQTEYEASNAHIVGDIEVTPTFSITSATDSATILDYIETNNSNLVKEWRFWNSVSSTGTDQSPIINLYNDKAGEVAVRFNRAVDNTSTGAMSSNAWIIHIPPSTAAGDYHFNITRDNLGNYFAIDESGNVSIGHAVANTTDGIAQLGVVGGKDTVQCIVQGHTTQTNDIFQVKNSGGSVLLSVGDSNPQLGAELDCNAKNLRNVNFLELDEISTPSPSTAHGALYTKNDNKLYFRGGNGVDYVLTMSTV